MAEGVEYSDYYLSPQCEFWVGLYLCSLPIFTVPVLQNYDMETAAARN